MTTKLSIHRISESSPYKAINIKLNEVDAAICEESQDRKCRHKKSKL